MAEISAKIMIMLINDNRTTNNRKIMIRLIKKSDEGKKEEREK